MRKQCKVNYKEELKGIYKYFNWLLNNKINEIIVSNKLCNIKLSLLLPLIEFLFAQNILINEILILLKVGICPILLNQMLKVPNITALQQFLPQFPWLIHTQVDSQPWKSTNIMYNVVQQTRAQQ